MHVDSFDVFERDFPELVEVDSRGNTTQHIDLLAQTKKEKRELTRATLISQNIWVSCAVILGADNSAHSHHPQFLQPRYSIAWQQG